MTAFCAAAAIFISCIFFLCMHVNGVSGVFGYNCRPYVVLPPPPPPPPPLLFSLRFFCNRVRQPASLFSAARNMASSPSLLRASRRRFRPCTAVSTWLPDIRFCWLTRSNPLAACLRLFYFFLQKKPLQIFDRVSKIAIASVRVLLCRHQSPLFLLPVPAFSS